MPIDASIYSQIRPTVQPDGPLDQYAKMISLKSMIGNNELNDMQRTKLARDLKEEEEFRNLFTGATPEQMNAPDFLQRAMGASPTRGMALQKSQLDHQKASAELQKLDLEARAAKAKDARDTLAGVTDQGSYDQWRTQAQQKGYPIGHSAPPAFDPNWQRQQLMTADKFIETTEKQKDRELTTRGQDLTRKSADERNAVLRRGQDMTDARQREVNGIMEGQQVEASPELVKSIARGEVDLPKPPTNARNPMMLARYDKLVSDVKKENPNWSHEMAATIKKTVGDFAAGKSSLTIQALSNATGHLDTYEKLALALKNGDTQAVNGIVNKVKEQFGSAAPTTPEAVSQMLAAEIVKAVAGTAGGVTDREHAQGIFSNRKSPEQMLEANAAIRELMGQQFRTLDQKYKAGTYGRTDFADRYLTSPEVRVAYDKAVRAHAAPGAAVEAAKKDQGAKGSSGIKFLGWEK